MRLGFSVHASGIKTAGREPCTWAQHRPGSGEDAHASSTEASRYEAMSAHLVRVRVGGLGPGRVSGSGPVCPAPVCAGMSSPVPAAGSAAVRRGRRKEEKKSTSPAEAPGGRGRGSGKAGAGVGVGAGGSGSVRLGLGRGWG